MTEKKVKRPEIQYKYSNILSVSFLEPVGKRKEDIFIYK